MKRRRLMRALGAIGLLILLPISGAAQVQIIRRPPPSGEEPSQATWSDPYSNPAQARETGKTDLSGRISVGGQGGQDKAGDALYNFTSDSLVSLVQPLGGDALLTFDATVLRIQSAIKEDQKYDGTLSLDFERLQFETSGGFSQSLSETVDVDSEDSDARISAAVSSGLIETLPMSLEYQSVWVNREDQSIETESSRSDELAFKTVGTVGTLGVDLRADLEYEDDREEQSEGLGTAGKLTVSVPMREQLTMLVNLNPLYTRSETQTYELQSTSLESGLGVNWILQENFDTILQLSRVDAWNNGEGVSYESYQNSWKGGLGVNYLPREGWFAGPAYTYTKAVGGNAGHDLRLLLGWRGNEELREVSGKSSSTFIRSESGDRVKDALDWQLKAALLPADSMKMDGKYQGGYIRQSEGESWRQKMGVDFSHSPDPGLTYKGAVSLSTTREEEEDPLWEQQYAVALMVKPIINFTQYTVNASETLDVSNEATGDDVLSAARMKVAFPLYRDLSGRVGFDWEWINRTSIGGDPGNYFRYTAGLSVAGKAAPFSLKADYGLAHGYRGVRHDIKSGIQVPLRKGYALKGDFTLSSYEEDNENTLYWVLSLHLVYNF